MRKNKNIIILAIETSCDDTGIAIVKTLIKNESKFNILSNIISSQVEIHRKYGGVYPMMAKREHQKNLVPVLKRALAEARLLKNPKSAGHKVDSPEGCILNPKSRFHRGLSTKSEQIQNFKTQKTKTLKEIFKK